LEDLSVGERVILKCTWKAECQWAD
jgi:hypothetical protein